MRRLIVSNRIITSNIRIEFVADEASLLRFTGCEIPVLSQVTTGTRPIASRGVSIVLIWALIERGLR